MNWIRENPRSALLCGATLLAPLALWLYLVLLLWGMRAEYVQQIDYLQPRIARLQGLIDFESQLQSASEQASALVAQLAIPGDGDLASESAALQREVRQYFAEAGMSVSNSLDH